MAESYIYDIDARNAAQEGYQLTEAELRELNARELEQFEQKVPMTASEKKALRKWVALGHSLRESPGSRYVIDIGMDFLDVYRTDHEIAAAVRGKTPAEKEAYIKEYIGYTEPSPVERERFEAIEATPAYVQKKYEKLYRQMLLLEDYLDEKGLWSDAQKYLENHTEDEIPTDFSFILE